MTIQEVTKVLEGIKARVSTEVQKTIVKILALASSHSFLEERFTFDSDADLDREVNALLIQLSDMVIADMETRLRKTIDPDDEEAVFAYIHSDADGRDSTETVDSQSSRLKFLLEAYLAVCFANNLTSDKIVGDVFLFLANPNGYEPMREATAHWQDYYTEVITQKGVHFGKGVAIDPVEGMTLTEQTTILEGYHFGVLQGYKRQGNIIGYKVHRGSDYDCPTCDELCIGIHPLDEQVLPAHPRCMCYETPVYAGDV